jgi:hypothetical protein
MLATGALVFLFATGWSRAATLGIEFATTERYAYITIVLLLPLMGLGLQALV